MKDLIVIGSYCPDEERIKMLDRCVDSLDGIRKDFDVMISSHTIVPDYISKKVEYTFYFKENEIITDWNYLNRPWFRPISEMIIHSCLVTEKSTYLAVYGVFLSSLGIAKSLNYETVHWIEYDSEIKDYSDLYENSKIVRDFVGVNYKQEKEDDKVNLNWGVGCFQTINLLKVPESMLKYDRNFLLGLLKNSTSKTNEKITEDLYLSEGGKIYYKSWEKLLEKESLFNLSSHTEKDSLNYWAVPFWDEKYSSLKFVVWNNKDYGNIDVVVILNDEKILSFNNISGGHWQIKDLGLLEETETITVLINGKIKSRIVLNDELRELFKSSSYSVYS